MAIKFARAAITFTYFRPVSRCGTLCAINAGLVWQIRVSFLIEFWKKSFKVSVDGVQVTKHCGSDWTAITRESSNCILTLKSKTELQMLYYQIGELLGVNDK